MSCQTYFRALFLAMSWRREICGLGRDSRIQQSSSLNLETFGEILVESWWDGRNKDCCSEDLRRSHLLQITNPRLDIANHLFQLNIGPLENHLFYIVMWDPCWRRRVIIEPLERDTTVWKLNNPNNCLWCLLRGQWGRGLGHQQPFLVRGSRTPEGHRLPLSVTGHQRIPEGLRGQF